MWCKVGYICQRCNNPIEEDDGCECIKNGLMPIYPPPPTKEDLDKLKKDLEGINELNEIIIPKKISIKSKRGN